jgi:hypothetical protein
MPKKRVNEKTSASFLFFINRKSIVVIIPTPKKISPPRNEIAFITGVSNGLRKM